MKFDDRSLTSVRRAGRRLERVIALGVIDALPGRKRAQRGPNGDEVGPCTPGTPNQHSSLGALYKLVC